jgi:type II secretory pathway component PulM
MTSMLRSAQSIWASLSNRERLLLSVLAGLAAAVGFLYLAILPGLAAARSAESRLGAARAELAEVKSLAAALEVQSEASGQVPIEAMRRRLGELAQTAGVVIDSVTADGESLLVKANVGSSAAALAWSEAASRELSIGVASLAIARGAGGRLGVEARFARASQ